MTRNYYIEARISKLRWTLLHTTKRHDDALDYVRRNSGEKYPLRIVRVVRTVVFDGSKS